MDYNDYEYFPAGEISLEEYTGIDEFGDHGGRRDRLRMRIEQNGFDGMPDHEILEFLLGYAIPRQDTNELARAMLEHFGDLKKSLHSKYEQIAKVEGMGEEAARWMDMVNRFIALCERMKIFSNIQLKNYGQVFSLIPCLWNNRHKRRCVQLCIDRYGRLMHRFYLPGNFIWNRDDAMAVMLDHAVCSRSYSIILVLMMDEIRELNVSEAKAVQDYACGLGNMNIALVDVVCADKRHVVSMRRKGYIRDEKHSKQMDTLRENYMRGMPESGEVDFETLAREYVLPEMDPVE